MRANIEYCLRDIDGQHIIRIYPDLSQLCELDRILNDHSRYRRDAPIFVDPLKFLRIKAALECMNRVRDNSSIYEKIEYRGAAITPVLHSRILLGADIIKFAWELYKEESMCENQEGGREFKDITGCIYNEISSRITADGGEVINIKKKNLRPQIEIGDIVYLFDESFSNEVLRVRQQTTGVTEAFVEYIFPSGIYYIRAIDVDRVRRIHRNSELLWRISK